MKKQITIEIETDFPRGLISETVNELVAKGYPNGCFQDYTAVTEVIGILSQAEMHYDGQIGGSNDKN